MPNNTLRVRTKDAEHRKSILKWLLNKGYLWHNEENWDEERIEKVYSYQTYPIIKIYINSKYLCGYESYTVEDTTVMELYERIK